MTKKVHGPVICKFQKLFYSQSLIFFSRYCIERVFRPRKLDRAHPRELVECAYDIITPVTSSLLPDAETIYTISEIVQEFPALQVVCSSYSEVYILLPSSHSDNNLFMCRTVILLLFLLMSSAQFKLLFFPL